MIPAWNDAGFLPPGIHQASLDEFRSRFVVFNRSDRRLRLFQQMERLFVAAQQSGIVKRIIVAGSFVTDKSEPNDFDCLLVLEPDILSRELRPFEYNLISRRMTRRLYGGDVASVIDESEAMDKYLAFFQRNRDGDPVGVVEVQL